MSPLSGITSGNVLCSQACAKTSPLGGATQGDVLLQEANAKTKHLISSGWRDPGEMPCFPRFRQTNKYLFWLLFPEVHAKTRHLPWEALPRGDILFLEAYANTNHLPWVVAPKEISCFQVLILKNEPSALGGIAQWR